ncbi:MAG: hypothetical protein N3E36_01790 [Sulfolobales archaeon]|nr:hypothetical protein [Sulfolobales archaeon]MCX8198746.1 hypothetical protein [Sulfolobales archaeon]MDW8169819.1 hypothetical protein [Desulfurococcaceae archaeon]
MVFALKSRGKVSLIIYLATEKGVRNVKHIYKSIEDSISVVDTYIVYYGLGAFKQLMDIPAFHSEPPYCRGKAILSGVNLVTSPVIVVINGDTSCFSIDSISNAVAKVLSGETLLHLSKPQTNTDFTNVYRSFLQDILGELGITQSMLYPSYSIIVGLRKFFTTTPYSMWSIEQLAAINLREEALVVENNSCIDSTIDYVKGFEKTFVKDLARKAVEIALQRNTISRNRAEEYLKRIEAA